MAPLAVEVATFQEDASADARSIVDGKALDIEDLTLHSVIFFAESHEGLGCISSYSTIYYELHPKSCLVKIFVFTGAPG